MSEKPMKMSPDEDLAKELRKDLTAAACVRALITAAADMAAATGVTVEWHIMDVDEDALVNRAALTSALCRLSTAGGAMLVGGKINPITTLDAQSPRRMIHNQQREDGQDVQ